MANIGNLAIKLTATAKELERELRHAREAVSEFALESSRRLGELGAVLLGGFGAFELGESLKKGAEDVEELVHAGERLGTTAEAIGGLKLAASDAGLGFEGIERALVKLEQVVGKAAGGSTEFRAKFEALGLSAQELAKLKPEEVFLKVGQRLSELENPFSRAAAGVDLFGKKWQEINGLFSEGDAKLKQALEDFKRLHGGINAVDAKRIKEAKEAIDRMKVAVEGLWERLSSALAPTITAVAKFISNLVIKIREWFTSLGITSNSVLTLVKVLVTATAAIIAYIAVMKAASIASAIFAAIGGALDPELWVRLGVGLAAAGAAAVIVASQFKGISTAADDAGKKVEKLGAASDKFKASSEVVNKVLELKNRLQSQIATFGQSSVSAEIRQLEQQMGQERRIAPGPVLDLKALETEQKRLQTILESTQKSLETLHDRAVHGQADISDRSRLIETIKLYDEQLQKIEELISQQKKQTSAQDPAFLEQLKAEQRHLEGLEQISTELARGLQENPFSVWAAGMDKLTEAFKAGKLSEQDFVNLSSQLDKAAEAAQRSLAFKVSHENLTDAEKFTAQIRELQALFERGLISPDTFQRAMEQAQSILGGADTAENLSKQIAEQQELQQLLEQHVITIDTFNRAMDRNLGLTKPAAIMSEAPLVGSQQEATLEVAALNQAQNDRLADLVVANQDNGLKLDQIAGLLGPGVAALLEPLKDLARQRLADKIKMIT